MANYQTITPVKLGQAAITAAYTTIYTAPISTRTYVKQFDVCNTTGGALTLYLHIVPSGGTADTSNAIYYGTAVGVNGVLKWTGVQVMNAGDTIQVKGSATGLTITASGGEAV
jgi:hypothetical protein